MLYIGLGKGRGVKQGSNFNSQNHSGKAGGRGQCALTPLQGTKGLSLSS